MSKHQSLALFPSCQYFVRVPAPPALAPPSPALAPSAPALALAPAPAPSPALLNVDHQS